MLSAKPERRSAILDQVSVTHTRPVGGGPIYDDLAKLDRAPRPDMEKILDRFVERPADSAILSGIRTNGRMCASRPKIAWLTRTGLRTLGETPDRGRLRKEAKRKFREHLRKRPPSGLFSTNPAAKSRDSNFPSSSRKPMTRAPLNSYPLWLIAQERVAMDYRPEGKHGRMV